MSTKLSNAQVGMLKSFDFGGRQINERSDKADTKRAAKLVSLGMATAKFGKYGFVIYDLTDEGRAHLAALEPVEPEPDAPTDATLGDALYERAEAVEEATAWTPVIGEYAMHGDCRVKVRKQDDEGMYHIVFFNEKLKAHQTYRLKASDLGPLGDPRDVRIAQLEAELAQAKVRISELEAAQGLFPKEVYAAYVASQDTHLSPVQDSYACMAIRDTMSDAIINRPDGYPIVQEAHS